MRIFVILLLTVMLYIPTTVSAYIQNGDYECGYYTTIYGEKHPVSKFDSHKITPALDLNHNTRKREYSGAWAYEYVPVSNLFYKFQFTLYLLNENDNFNFDKSKSILAKFGNKNYILSATKIYKAKKEQYIDITADISNPCMNALIAELSKGSSAYILFSLPMNNDSYVYLTLNSNEVKEFTEGIIEFSKTLQ